VDEEVDLLFFLSFPRKDVDFFLPLEIVRLPEEEVLLAMFSSDLNTEGIEYKVVDDDDDDDDISEELRSLL
jgi:hypothetical protein